MKEYIKEAETSKKKGLAPVGLGGQNKFQNGKTNILKTGGDKRDSRQKKRGRRENRVDTRKQQSLVPLKKKVFQWPQCEERKMKSD